MSKSAAQKKAHNNYAKKIKLYRFECYPNTEPEIIEKLEKEKQAGGYAKYIKKLIREDIART